MKVTITFAPEQAKLARAYLARSPYSTPEEWLSELVAGVLAPYAQTLPTAGPIKTLMEQRAALEQSIRAAVKPSVTTAAQETPSEAN